MARPVEGYDENVFINCPFDRDYETIFNSLVFGTFFCGLRPRCALEVSDAGEARFEKIARIVGECRWGIHDISRTESGLNGLPRFNMPLELGFFLGARRFGDRVQRQKSCLVLDRERYRFQQYISDIAGQGIMAHRNQAICAIKAVRDRFVTSRAVKESVPGAPEINDQMVSFTADLPAICNRTKREVGELTFVEYADTASVWIRTKLKR